MSLSILNDPLRDRTQELFARFERERVLERVRHFSEDDGEMVALGTETDAEGRVTKNSFGVLDLAWKAAQHPEWAQQIAAEIAEIRGGMGTLRFVIWAGMGGSIEDKSMYNAAGLLRGGPRLYSLDSTDPAKLKAIVEDMQRTTGETLERLLPSTLVVGMAMGMTSYEPVVNLERLAFLYDKYGIDSRANFIYMTLPGSILDRFAGPRGYRRVPLQPDGENSTAGRHSAPLTRGSLYPLALAGVDLTGWMAGTNLSDEEIAEAFKLAAFLQAQATEGRDKIALLLPLSWHAAGLWTKQDFEESLGKSETIGIKIVIGEKVRLRSYRRVGDPKQDRAFLAIQRKGEAHPEARQITALRHASYPVAVVTFPQAKPLSHYMQFIHYVVFGLGFLRGMNFVTQPGVELYKAIAGEIFQAKNQHALWSSLPRPAPKELAATLKRLAREGAIEYGDLTWFGDLRYSEEGRGMRESLERAADRVFRSRLKMPADIYEGPAMNHSYHEMVIGHGRAFSIVMTPAEQARFPAAQYEPAYHVAQFLATKLALERRGRHVLAFPVSDRAELDEYFQAVATQL